MEPSAESEYDASVLERDSIDRFARKVAAATAMPLSGPVTYSGEEGLIEAVGPHWEVESRDHNIERHTINGAETVRETTLSKVKLALLKEGELVSFTLTRTTAVTWGGSNAGLMYDEYTHLQHPATDGELLRMDVERAYFESGGPDSRWGDLDPGTRLIHRNKGAGITAALTGLLGEGERTHD